MINLYLYKIYRKDEIIDSKIESKKRFYKIYKSIENEFFKKNNLVVSYSKNGKPLLKCGFISISHCDNYLAIALCEKNIGVDIEKFENIGDRVLTLLNKNNLEVLIKEKLLKKYTFIESYVKYNDSNLLNCLENIIFENGEYYFGKDKIDLHFENLKIDDYICTIISENKHEINLITEDYYES